MKDPRLAFESVSALAKRFDLRVKHGSGDLIEGSFDSVVLKLQKILAYEALYPGALVHADVKDSRYGHAVGLFQDLGDFHFFDPNVGEYRVPVTRLEFFLAKYREILRRYGWDYSDTWGVPVGRKDPAIEASSILDWIYPS